MGPVSTEPAKLVTIRFSHYCEKARWALERAGVKFIEDYHSPLFHMRAVKRAGGKRTTPVLALPDRVIADSTDILHYADTHGAGLFPLEPAAREAVTTWEDYFDDKLGPAVRRYVYFLLFQVPRPLAIDLFRSAAAPGEARWVSPLHGLIRFGMKKGLNITPAASERSRQTLTAVTERVEAHLADGRKYLEGDRFSAADLTFASLVGPLVGPPTYGAPLPGFAEIPEPFASVRDAYIARPAGQFALRLYRDHRLERVGG